MWWLIGGVAVIILLIVWSACVVAKEVGEDLERWLEEQHRSGQ